MRKSARIKFLILLAAIGTLCLGMAGTAMAGRVLLPAGTEVKVKFDPRAKITSGDVIAGVPLVIELAEPLKIGGAVIVDSGATGTATVKEAVKAGGGGKGGSITVAFTELQPKGTFATAEGKAIKLTGEVSAKGTSRKTLSYLLGFGLIIKGHQGVIPTDTVYTARTAEDIFLESP